jgi:very-long-chain (3R)-3-hydroxyacyl-CoA dehydratase
MKLRDAYLVIYNAAMAVGWSICLVQVLLHLHDGLAYEVASHACLLSQTVSILETAHSMVGLVKSSPAMNFVQWAGRSHVLVFIIHAIPDLHSSIFSTVLLLVWSLSEVIRYPWYAFSALPSGPPFALTWLRYTAFIILYPIGVVCEMNLIYLALPILVETGVYQGRSIRLPNAFNFAFDYTMFCRILLAVYLGPWWFLYSSLLRMRRKKIGGTKVE